MWILALKILFLISHTLGEIEVDATLTRIKVQDMKVECWNLPKDVQVWKLNLCYKGDLKMVNFNADLDDAIVGDVEALLWKYKDVFAWSYKELIGIPHTLFNIELNSTLHSH